MLHFSNLYTTYSKLSQLGKNGIKSKCQIDHVPFSHVVIFFHTFDHLIAIFLLSPINGLLLYY